MSPRLHVAGQPAACAPLDVVSMLRCRMGRGGQASTYAVGEHVALQHGARLPPCLGSRWSGAHVSRAQGLSAPRVRVTATEPDPPLPYTKTRLILLTNSNLHPLRL